MRLFIVCILYVVYAPNNKKMEKLPTILREQIYERLRRRNDDHDNRNNDDDDDAGLDMVSLRQLLREQALFVLFCPYPCTLITHFHLCYLEW